MRTLSPIVVALALLACDRVFPYEPRSAPTRPGDGAADGPGVDGARADGATPDTARQPDAALVDAALVDTTPIDATSVDSTFIDASPVDATPLDAGANTDATVIADAGAVGPCIPGTQPFKLAWSSTMVMCELGTGSIDQCSVASLCTGGWHLCTASEYKDRGGDKNAPPGKYWLASCVRLNSSVFPTPSDSACAAPCSLVSTGQGKVSWNCSSTGTTSFNNANIGVSTSSTCHRLGSDVEANRAYWEAVSLTSNRAGAACCQ